jgi:anti-sigma B factor antagonist
MIDCCADRVGPLPPGRVELSFVAEAGSDVITCEVRGELDAATATTLRGSAPFLTHAPAALIDLSGVTFIDALGLGALIGTLRRVQESGTAVALVVSRPGLAALLTANGIDARAPIARSRPAALAALVPAATHDEARRPFSDRYEF